jgi:signal transduction histidine kinase/ActR/RegA family two-component response regulator
LFGNKADQEDIVLREVRDATGSVDPSIISLDWSLSWMPASANRSGSVATEGKNAPANTDPPKRAVDDEQQMPAVAINVLRALLLLMGIVVIAGNFIGGGPVIRSAALGIAAAVTVARVILVREERLLWTICAVALCAWTGQLYYIVVPNAPVTFPALPDYMALIFYAGVLLSIVLFVKSRLRDWRNSVWLDGVIGGLALSALASLLVFHAALAGSGVETRIVNGQLGYAISDLFVLGFLGAIALLGRWRLGLGGWGFLAAFSILALGDSLYVSAVANEQLLPSSLVTSLWAFGSLTLAATATTRRHVARASNTAGVVPVALLGLSAMSSLCLLLAYQAGLARETPALAALAAVVLGVIVVRFCLTLLENARILKESKLSELRLEQAQEERALLLKRTLHAAEHERMLMAAELHDGPIQHLASFGYTLDRVDRRLADGDLVAGIDLLRAVRKDLTHEVGTLRRLMYELRSPVLDERGVEAALREYVSDFEDRTGTQCTFVSELGETRLDVDSETVLYRVTQEALTNVAKYSEADQARVELRPLEDGVSLVISDDGVGFEPALLTELVRDNHFGLLGLRERVDGVGGESRIETAPGRGTRVEVTLPSCPQPVPRPHSPKVRLDPKLPAASPTTPFQASVLVVDDDPSIRGVLVALLVDHGFDVVGEAANGAEAVALAKQLRPDLVLMDIRMPVMDGPQAARLIHGKVPSAQIVLLSGDDDRIGVADELAAGVFDLVAKDGQVNVICETLDNAFRFRQEQRGRAA